MVLLFSDSLYSPDSFTPEISTVGSFFLELFLNGFVNLLVFFVVVRLGQQVNKVMRAGCF